VARCAKLGCAVLRTMQQLQQHLALNAVLIAAREKELLPLSSRRGNYGEGGNGSDASSLFAGTRSKGRALDPAKQKFVFEKALEDAGRALQLKATDGQVLSQVRLGRAALVVINVQRLWQASPDAC
jgi:hypothetical protein